MIPPEHSVESKHSSRLAAGNDPSLESASRPDATGFSEVELGDAAPNAIPEGTRPGGVQFVNPVEALVIPRFPWNTDSTSKAVRKGPA